MSLKVSIVTPSYNQGTYIGQTIESVLSQDYPHLDYWIIDGGSEDETLDVIRTYEGDGRLHWISEPDGGMSAALNKGFQRSTGQIMTWINSDDLLAEGVVGRVVAHFEQNPNVQMLYGRVQFIEADGRPRPYHMGRDFDLLGLLADYIGPLPQPGCFWHRGLWERLGPLRDDLHYVMDMDYWLRASQHTRPHFLPALHAYCRVHPHSKTTSQEVAAYQERGALLAEVLSQAELYPLPPKAARLVAANQARFLAQAQWRAGNRPEARQAIREALRTYPHLDRHRLYLGALAADYHLGTGLAATMSAVWQRIKKRIPA